MFLRLARIASALRPVWGIVGMFRSVVATFICLRMSAIADPEAKVTSISPRARETPSAIEAYEAMRDFYPMAMA